ncbi:bacterial bifunctional deaminase-reductase [Trametes maxima]|nr:bacterial bifunctional deaminase-reductase [Trametes maxima]
MAESNGDNLPQPPSILLDLYGLSVTPESHPSVFDPSREDALPTAQAHDPARPYVTLTFAQSLDAKIAGAGGKQLALSGKESLVMTHWMRTLHDAILVGIGTALNDDPQLNTRHLPPLPSAYPYGYRLPRPIIIDTHLRLLPHCKLLKNYQAGNGRRPWVICASQRGTPSLASSEAFAARATVLQSAGARIVEVDIDANTGSIAILAVLAALRQRGIRSLMVEGGARVIRSFLSATHASAKAGSEVVDALVITVAPTLVGSAGVGYGAELHADTSAEWLIQGCTKLPTFQHVRTEVFGPDTVMALKVL